MADSSGTGVLAIWPSEVSRFHRPARSPLESISSLVPLLAPFQNFAWQGFPERLPIIPADDAEHAAHQRVGVGLPTPGVMNPDAGSRMARTPRFPESIPRGLVEPARSGSGPNRRS